MANSKSGRLRTLVEIIIYVLLFGTWMIFWAVSLFESLPINYLLSLVPLLFGLWKLTRSMSHKFIVGITSCMFLFFVIFDFINGTIPQQMNIVIRYDAAAVYDQWGRSLILVGVANYLFDTIVDSLVGFLVVAFIHRIISLLKQ